MKRGEIRWYKFRSPDKKRPVLILTRNPAIEFLDDVNVAPITTTVRDIPTEVVLEQEDGMPRSCAVNLDHLQTIPKAKIGALITTIPQVKLAQVFKALCFALGFPID
jgi:mRNA interferase MazF